MDLRTYGRPAFCSFRRRSWRKLCGPRLRVAAAGSWDLRSGLSARRGTSIALGLGLDLPANVPVPDAARYVAVWLDERIEKLRRKLCNHAAASGVRILVREGENSAKEHIWVIVQVAEPQNLARALQRIKRSITQVMYDQSAIARAFYRQRWDSIRIVPLFNGRTVLHIMFQGHIASYCMSRDVEFFPDRVNDEMLSSLGIPRWDSEVARQAELLWVAAQKLKFSLERLVEVDSAPCDGEARTLAEAHRWRWHAEWVADANSAIAAADWLAAAAQREPTLLHALPPDEAGTVFGNIADCLNSVSAVKPTEFRALDLRDIVVPFVEQVDVLVTYLMIYLSGHDAVPFIAC